MDICKEAMPEYTTITETHGVHCWLQHPYAPKVERPVGNGGAANGTK